MKSGVFPGASMNLDEIKLKNLFNSLAQEFNRTCVQKGWAPEGRRFDTRPPDFPNPDRLREFYER
jgi:hypothetical protein